MLTDQCYIVTYKTQHQQRIIDGQNGVGETATEPFAKSYYNFFLVKNPTMNGTMEGKAQCCNWPNLHLCFLWA